MSEQTPTYESLQNDPKFLSSAHHTLNALSIPTSENPQEIIDNFLTHRRYFNTNIGSTIKQGSRIMDLPDQYKKAYAYATDQIEKMPDFGDGAPPLMDGVLDYSIAGVTDPTNLVSILAGAFTAGAGGVAGFAAKEAVKKGFINRLKAAITKNALKAYAVEGTIAGAGGAAQAVRGQQVDIDIGRRKDYDATHIALQGLAEGVLSPLAGAGLNVVGGTAKDAVSGLAKTIDDHTSVGNAGRWIKNRILPTSSLDEVSQRLVERSTGEMRPIQKAAEKLSVDIDDTFKKDFKPDEHTDLLNLALEGDKAALKQVKGMSPKMHQHITDLWDYVKQAQEIAGTAKYGSNYVKGIYKPTKKPYIRDIFEKFTAINREPFEQFIKKSENSGILDELRTLIVNNKDIAKQAGFLDQKGKWLNLSPERTDQLIEKFAKQLYDPIGSAKRRKLGVLKKKEEMPEVMRKLFGYNFEPGARAMETVRGIVDSSSKFRMASSLVDSLLTRGKAVKAGNALEAESMTGEPMVPYITSRNLAGEAFNEDAVFAIPMGPKNKGLLSPELNKVYVTKAEAAKLKMLTDEFNQPEWGWFKPLIDVMAPVQGYLKKGVTIYNPLAHIRNFLGMTGYTIGSGNYMGLIDGINFLGKNWNNPGKRKEIINAIDKLGLTGSQVELNQILNRINDFNKVKDPNKLQSGIVNVMTGFLPGLEKFASRWKTGRKAVKAAQDIYGGTDDLGKIMTFFREQKRSQGIWDEMTPERRNQLRKDYADNFQEKLRVEGDNPKLLKDFDDKVISEMAVEKTMNIVPIYSRIPKVLERMRGVPILGSFTAFPAENLRNKYKLFQLAGNEIREGMETGNKAMVKAGANRLVAQLGVASAPSIVASTYNWLNETEGVADAMATSLPDWEKDHAIVVRKDKDGNFKYTDLSYNNPDQYVLDFIMPFMHEVASGRDVKESLDEKFMQILRRQAKVFADPSLATKQIFDTVGGNLLKSFMGSPEEQGNALIDWYKLQETGLGKMARETLQDLGAPELIDEITKPLGMGRPASKFEAELNKLYYGDQRYRFNDTEELADFFAKHGLNTKHGLAAAPFTLAAKERTFNPRKQFAFTLKGLLKPTNTNRRDLMQDITNQLSEPNPTVEPLDVAQDYEDYLRTDFEAHRAIHELISSYRRFIPPQTLNRVIMQDKDVTGSLGNNQLRGLINDKYIPKKLSTNNKFLMRIKKNNPKINLITLKDILAQIENKYNGLGINLDIDRIETVGE